MACQSTAGAISKQDMVTLHENIIGDRVKPGTGCRLEVRWWCRPESTLDSSLRQTWGSSRSRSSWKPYSNRCDIAADITNLALFYI